MTLDKFVPARMQEIMNERGMNPADFIRGEKGVSCPNYDKLTTSRFYNVLSGKTPYPTLDFVQSFCDVAGIHVLDFFVKGRSEEVKDLSNDEMEMIRIMRNIRRRDETHLLSYARFLQQQSEKKEP